MGEERRRGEMEVGRGEREGMVCYSHATSNIKQETLGQIEEITT